MPKFTTYLFVLLLSLTANSQNDSISKWRTSSLAGMNGTQSSFVNWNAGGQNNIALMGYINAFGNYTCEPIKWSNDFSIALGGLKYLGPNSPQRLQKTEDKLELGTNFGYRMKKHCYLSLVAGFRTQMLDGFPDINSIVKNSAFLAPGYLNIALGADYKPNEHLSVFLSPFSSKMTIVMDDSLANVGAFGVAPAEYDPVTGAMVRAGEQFRKEFGAYFKIIYEKEIVKNIVFRGKLDLFSNYLDKPQNIDVNADVLFRFKINGWFSASLNWTVIYDDDIQITDLNGNTGPRLQFKSVLGIGAAYELKNFEDAKKK